jgi:hypothetical protein
MHPKCTSGSERGYGRPTAGQPQQGARNPLYFAKRALARGQSPELAAAAIASYRRYEKNDAAYYAKLTVKKAGEALVAEKTQEMGPER